jgi:hypothetical protein
MHNPLSNGQSCKKRVELKSSESGQERSTPQDSTAAGSACAGVGAVAVAAAAASSSSTGAVAGASPDTAALGVEVTAVVLLSFELRSLHNDVSTVFCRCNFSNSTRSA